jgi:hypothetical protein
VPGVTNLLVQTELLQGRDRDVVDWRRDQLVSSGFPEDLGSRLAAETRYDLHALIDLVERGCPPELAVRILAPLEVADSA